MPKTGGKEQFIKMTYETFLKEKERVANLPVQEQKAFYAKILEEEQQESSIRLQAYFQYAVLFYYEGDFRKAREIMEPFAISYQSYEYIPEMIPCFNLMGVASQCEGEYVLSRYFYTLALKVIREHNEAHYYAYEYNNISLTYIVQENYETAFQYIQLAEKYLPLSDKKMGSYIYLNKSDIYSHLGRMEEAVQAFEKSIKEYDGFNFLPDDTLICGVALFYKLGDKAKYKEYIGRILDKLEVMYASEFIDACRVVFECSLDDGDYDLVERVTEKMDRYMRTHPNENRVGLKVEQLKYTYAKKTGDLEAELRSLEKKNHYYELIVSAMEEQRASSMDEYLETHRHLQEAVQNEMQANRAKTRFLTNMSHDICTPMNAIVGITNLMEHALYRPEKLENYLSKIQLSSRHMLGLINDLLDMNKIESGTAQLHAEPMKLADQITQIQDIIRPQTMEKCQDFQIHTYRICHENLIADGIRLRQILLNVLSNAVKYTPEGGQIRFDIEESTGDTPERARYRFTVTDTGIGMDEELLSHIFDPFIRGEDSAVNKIQGTGLGMAITKNIVDLMGGTIEIHSEVGKGSRVEIILEFDIDREEDTKMEPLKLLLLSKDTVLAEDLTAAEQTKPVSVMCVSDENEACRALEHYPADVVLFGISFCASALVNDLRRRTGSTALFLALDEAGISRSSRQCEKIGLSGKITWPFFFSKVEAEVNRIRSGTGEMTGESVLAGMHFLCAEDNELNAEILTASLEIAGASCTVCEDGAELVETFASVKPGDFDAILMDIQMPNMDGYEATRRIRAGENPLGKTIPIIAMTANAFVEDVNNSLAAGMNAHLSKPIDMAVLESTMRRMKNLRAEEDGGND